MRSSRPAVSIGLHVIGSCARWDRGGQGVVYLSERRGADGFTLPIAIKVFSPEKYSDTCSYEEDMSRIAHVAARVAQIQQEHLLSVNNFVDRSRIRMMVMEWIDGYDLAHLLIEDTLARVKDRVSAKRWDYINRVIVTRGITQSRLKPGTAIAVVRDCLGALAALHREGIVHGDINHRISWCDARVIRRSLILVPRSIWTTRRRDALAHRRTQPLKSWMGPSVHLEAI